MKEAEVEDVFDAVAVVTDVDTTVVVVDEDDDEDESSLDNNAACMPIAVE